MPDSLDFDHLVDRGNVFHRCVECGWPGYGVVVRESDRKRHHAEHERARRKEAERTRKANLAKARKAQRAYRKENE